MEEEGLWFGKHWAACGEPKPFPAGLLRALNILTCGGSLQNVTLGPGSDGDRLSGPVSHSHLLRSTEPFHFLPFSIFLQSPGSMILQRIRVTGLSSCAGFQGVCVCVCVCVCGQSSGSQGDLPAGNCTNSTVGGGGGGRRGSVKKTHRPRRTAQVQLCHSMVGPWATDAPCASSLHWQNREHILPRTFVDT